jgi:hypothetical protein
VPVTVWCGGAAVALVDAGMQLHHSSVDIKIKKLTVVRCIVLWLCYCCCVVVAFFHELCRHRGLRTSGWPSCLSHPLCELGLWFLPWTCQLLHNIINSPKTSPGQSYCKTAVHLSLSRSYLLFKLKLCAIE